ncbi:NADP-dependent oxidoreductase [Pseudomonas gingeri]|uniref:NADP-dependent oxidoreductase n=1 Tax=Pseudomonas gingeri TaxID=117681 RepID=UPI00159FBD4E|nr:NADP-dependent oxidoreductase [Pseudomonas gingeri]NWA04860.1 NADP-dependent oxidoreductase [Pseudomonas gingeri]NWA17741.1 NADP-dependent oxidoreductase [Pseudomonas gingeri]NWA56851.1 NADP-dependent oxidoreductase [Pseudomonas gingeri]NWA97283.1 NADP-dependent oxidoreductase [Pseudomonas gingeri]NWB01665.1 NADP-dependent oxidoreductase [Pseudomonas gingeri]
MSHTQNPRIVLAARPEGLPKPTDFRLEYTDIPAPGEGQVLLENLYLSLDPYMRGRMSAAKSYAESIAIGEVMVGATIARIKHSRHPQWREGDLVLADAGWQHFALSNGQGLRLLDPGIAPPTTALGVLGMPGFTAYAGLRNIGQPKPGETLVVAAASGAVGSVVGQLARIQGARAVGIAGGAQKCAFVKNELGFDAVVDHQAPDFAEKLAEACPNGIDVYFENVSGAVWDAVRPLLNDFARIPVCGVIAHYNDASPSASVDRLPATMRDILTKSLTVRGFIQHEFVDRQQADFLNEAAQWIAQGKLKWREDIVDGLAQAPQAFIGLLQGKNFGKLIVRLGDL